MEADQARQSASTPANNSDSHPHTPRNPYPPQPYRESSERPYHDLPAMATATVLQPGSSYPPPPQSSYPSAYGSGSAPEPRRNPEETETASRQSLPSISEVISKTANQYPAPTQPTAQTNSSFPLPFSGPPRLHGEAEKHASPQGPPTIGQFSQFSVRRDPQPTFAESPRPSSSARPVLPGLPERRPSPPSIRAEYNHAHAHEAHRDPRAVNGAYPHPTAPAPAPSNSYPSGHLPQGQMPLPSYPSSPRHGPPQAYSGYDRLGPPGQMEEAARDARAQYEAQNAYPAPWSYGEALGRLAQSARTTYGFAEAYGRIAQEQHGAAPIPERLPSDQEVTDVIANFELQRAALERVREVIAQTIRNERARDLPKQPKISYQDDHDVPMFEDAKGPYEVKKRRGRAAPPGRCHSCNRVDTPEWRRGPDGARTLCNACGLHYAKLERKRQLEQRNIRPKPNEDRV